LESQNIKYANVARVRAIRMLNFGQTQQVELAPSIGLPSWSPADMMGYLDALIT
jgi:hypothetical protein